MTEFRPTVHIIGILLQINFYLIYAFSAKGKWQVSISLLLYYTKHAMEGPWMTEFRQSKHSISHHWHLLQINALLQKKKVSHWHLLQSRSMHYCKRKVANSSLTNSNKCLISNKCQCDMTYSNCLLLVICVLSKYSWCYTKEEKMKNFVNDL